MQCFSRQFCTSYFVGNVWQCSEYKRKCGQHNTKELVFYSLSAKPDLHHHFHHSPNLSRSLEQTLSLYSSGTEKGEIRRYTQLYILKRKVYFVGTGMMNRGKWLCGCSHAKLIISCTNGIIIGAQLQLNNSISRVSRHVRCRHWWMTAYTGAAG